MGLFLIIPVVVGLLTVDGPSPSPQKQVDFSRLQSVIWQSVYIADFGGNERLVKLVAATDHSVTIAVAGWQTEVNRDAVLMVDRARDSSLDGAIKGGVFAVALAVVATLVSGEFPAQHTMRALVVYGGIGYALDRGHRNRTPVYRAPTAAISLRF